ncbi:hypothetical protein K466DRAFT_566366 [Polyporus arcularius HHB13444]|uniref:Thioester reductase (TE) domain-containing protein n=1 Tax=Polyporus arcularius HHB13444 TaxID=1314778 RepID=A0A5C3PAB6_9APHY|nr:hypothetical protein K466DRAFT_566366 [Polyporus arcularius HHB13444]
MLSRTGRTPAEDQDVPTRVMQMRSLLAKYSADFPVAHWTQTAATGGRTGPGCVSGGTVVITGTTGCFGSHLLAQLLQSTDVARVYALNRQSSGDVVALQERQRDAFKKWRLHWDDSWLTEHRVSFHIADLVEPLLGLPQAIYDELRRSVTTIIHNAWAVNFALPLSSYEPLISGTRNLLDLALGTPTAGGPRVIFVSSAGAVWNQPPSVAARESLDVEPEVAVSMGYTESKWVAEQLFRRAAEERGLRTTVVRVTQLSGDSHTGSWNTAELIPACVPRSEDVLCPWVPIDVAAAALLEMVAYGSDERALHIIAPRPTTWNDVYGLVAVELNVPMVPVSEFLERLWASARASGGRSAQALRLAGILEMHAVTRIEIDLDIERAVRVSRTLSTVAPVGRADVRNWLSFWEQIGFLAPSAAKPRL